MQQGSHRAIHHDLADFELWLQTTAAAGRPSPWIDRLRTRVHELRTRDAVREQFLSGL